MEHITDNLVQAPAFREIIDKWDSLELCREQREQMLLCIIELFFAAPLADGIEILQKYFGHEDAKNIISEVVSKI